MHEKQKKHKIIFPPLQCFLLFLLPRIKVGRRLVPKPWAPLIIRGQRNKKTCIGLSFLFYWFLWTSKEISKYEKSYKNILLLYSFCFPHGRTVSLLYYLGVSPSHNNSGLFHKLNVSTCQLVSWLVSYLVSWHRYYLYISPVLLIDVL